MKTIEVKNLKKYFSLKTKNFWVFVFAALILLFPALVYADIAPPIPVQIGEFFLFAVPIFAIDFIFNFLILVLAYLFIKKKNFIKSLRFLWYVFLVTFGGFIIDIITLLLVMNVYDELVIASSKVPPVIIPEIAYILVSFIPLALYNYFLSKKFYNLNKKEALIIGLFMGIFTNPGFLFVIYSLTGWGDVPF